MSVHCSEVVDEHPLAGDLSFMYSEQLVEVEPSASIEVDPDALVLRVRPVIITARGELRPAS